METTQIGWLDAGYGNLLLQSKPMQFQSQKALPAGLQADGDIRNAKSLQLANGQTLLIFAVYGDQLKAFTLVPVRQKISARPGIPSTATF